VAALEVPWHPQKLIDLMENPYTNTVSCIQADVSRPTGFHSLQEYGRFATSLQTYSLN